MNVRHYYPVYCPGWGHCSPELATPTLESPPPPSHFQLSVNCAAAWQCHYTSPDLWTSHKYADCWWSIVNILVKTYHL